MLSNQPGPCVCIYCMIQTLVHTWRGWGCSTFKETSIKRQSNPLPFKACSLQQCTEHIQPRTIVSKYDSKQCVHFGTTARVIRVLKGQYHNCAWVLNEKFYIDFYPLFKMTTRYYCIIKQVNYRAANCSRNAPYFRLRTNITAPRLLKGQSREIEVCFFWS